MQRKKNKGKKKKDEEENEKTKWTVKEDGCLSFCSE